jgi:hypothetical protein
LSSRQPFVAQFLRLSGCTPFYRIGGYIAALTKTREVGVETISIRDRELTVRFAIGDEQGARSSVWRIWKGRGKDDIYVAPRSVAGIMKGSLHASGRCHFAVTTQHYERISTGGGAMLRERTITAWERRRPSPVHDVVQAVSILFAAEFLSDKSYPVGPGTRLIDTPVPGKAIIVDFLFAMQAVGQLLLRPNQTELGRVVLANGELFLVIAGVRAASARLVFVRKS